MFKFVVVFAVCVAATSAGLIGHGIAVAPAVAPIALHAAPLAAATSYQNSNSLSLHATPVVAAPIAKVAVAAAPAIAFAHGPALPLAGHGLGYGLHH